MGAGHDGVLVILPMLSPEEWEAAAAPLQGHLTNNIRDELHGIPEPQLPNLSDVTDRYKT